jgi:RHS repeat-associated protein
MCDTDGKGTNWQIDSTDRVTRTEEWPGTAEGFWIITSQQWDNTSNNLVSTTDANNNQTLYGYDNTMALGWSCCGNLVEMQQPQSGDISNGPLAPVSYYSYDQNFNVTAYCDPVYNQTKNNRWVPSPGGQDNLCPVGGAKTTTMVYNNSTNEPFGCLSSISKPMAYQTGYQTNISYPTGNGACGVGLPNQVQANKQITNYDQQSTRRPTQNFSYDGNGNLRGYDKGQGDDSWTLSYNQDNRLVEKTNNDSSISGAAITSTSCYYPDGSLFYTETPSQWANESPQDPACPSMQTMLSGPQSAPQHATAYYYDYDGDVIKMTTHKGCSDKIACPGAGSANACKSNTTEPVGTTCKYYDGLDRLVETAEPYDTRSIPLAGSNSQPYEFYPYRWMNRYIYDLSQSGGSANLTISDGTGTISGLAAYGNLYKTQEYLAQTTQMKARLDQQGSLPAPGWNDVRGTSFDALDRTVGKYELAYLTTPGPKYVTLNAYDCSGNLDLLCSTVNQVGQTTTYTYDNIARIKQETFTGTAPQADGPRNFTYDADGRTATISANTMGAMGYTYDLDGNKTSVTEPANEQAASLICYSLYPDGLREYLDIGVAGKDSCGSITSGPNPGNGGIRQAQLFRYSYTNDGLLATQQVNWNGVQVNQETPTFNWTYTPSGREDKEIDPLQGMTAWYPGGQTSATISSKKYSYDQYGRVSSLSMAEPFTETSFDYDNDDELVSYQTASGGITRQLRLNARGEVLGDLAQAPTYSANGTELGNGNSPPPNYNQEAPNGLQLDMRSGMITAISNPLYAQEGGLPAGAGAYVYTYDGAGRQTTATQFPNWPNGGDTSPAYSQTFDGENHIAHSSSAGAGNTVNAQWGPDGRQRDVHYVGGADYSAHWDGDSLLFYTDANDTTLQLYIGKLATIDIKGNITVFDRDQTGEKQTAHGYLTSWGKNGVWFDSWNLAGARNLWIAKGNSQQTVYPFTVPGTCGYYDVGLKTYENCPPYTPQFDMARPDGYNMVGGYVQGARTYDPTSGQWLTPDAYAGDVHDPMSQKPFMYNNNNPVEWEDPSGYCAWDLCIGEGIAVGEIVTAIAALATMAVGSVLKSREDSSAVHQFRGENLPLQGTPNTQERRGQSVIQYGPNGDATKRIDLGGRSHGGIDPPHVQDYKTRTNPETGQSYVKKDGKVRSATPDEAQEANDAPEGQSPLPKPQTSDQNSPP